MPGGSAAARSKTSPATCRSNGSASRRTSRRHVRISCPTRRVTSPGRSSASTAAGSSDERRGARMNQQEMADLLEIEQLAARYMMLSARKENDRWLEVFTADGVYNAFGTPYG